jgi:hypothetical protein
MIKNRALICTFSALTSGCFAGYIGWQIAFNLHSQKCQSQIWGVKQLCSTAIVPSTIWQGGTTGVWTGTILGAFFGALVTRTRGVGSRE